MNNNVVTVLAGPTSVGKGTISAYIRAHYPQVWLSVSATTRPPRPGEEEGSHYYFKTTQEFELLVAEGAFLEWAQVHGHYFYGTLKTTVDKAVAEGKKVLLEIDVQGARQIRKKMPEAHFVFLAPPSWEELIHRLENRGTETKQEQRRRLETAKQELAAETEFDRTIINDAVERAAAELVDVMGV